MLAKISEKYAHITVMKYVDVQFDDTLSFTLQLYVILLIVDVPGRWSTENKKRSLCH